MTSDTDYRITPADRMHGAAGISDRPRRRGASPGRDEREKGSGEQPDEPAVPADRQDDDEAQQQEHRAGDGHMIDHYA